MFTFNRKSIRQGLTSTDNLLNLDKGNIDFLGKFSHRLIWVLIGERVDINLDPCERKTNRVVGKERKEMLRDLGEAWRPVVLKNDFLNVN